MTNLLTRALAFAHSLFDGKRCDVTGLPAMAHLYQMVQVVADYGGSETVQAAAVLQACPAFAGVGMEDITRGYGRPVTTLVEAVQRDRTKSRKEQHEGLMDLALVCDSEVAVIVMANALIKLLSLTRRRRGGRGPVDTDGETGKRYTEWYVSGLLKSLAANRALSGDRMDRSLGVRTDRILNELILVFRQYQTVEM